MRRVVVCGSRDFNDAPVVDAVLMGLALDGETPYWVALDDHWRNNLIIIEGQCPYGGADKLAEEWALSNDVRHKPFRPKSNTAQHFHERNRAMIDSGADLCVAFVNKPLSLSRGTANTVHYARTKGVKTIVVEVQ